MENFSKNNEGRRVRLVYTSDRYTNLKPGDLGTYDYAVKCDGFIQHSIRWDNNSSLMLITPEDNFEFVEEN